jgi:hypothetical protein
MRRIIFSILALTLVGGLFTWFSPAAMAGTCAIGAVEVGGRVTDTATGLPLTETTSVGISGVSVKYEDGEGTNSASRWSTCLLPGTYKIKFMADDYRPEWHHDQPNIGAATVVTVPPTGPVVVNESMVPRGRVIAGRVTSVNGAPLDASVGIWRLTSTGWHAYDGIGNFAANGWYEFTAPGPGRYRIEADVDHYKSRWATSATHLSAARTFVLGVHSTFINDGHIKLPYCNASPSFCVPAGFLT